MCAVVLARLKNSRIISVAVTYQQTDTGIKLEHWGLEVKGHSRVTPGSFRLPMYGDLGYKLVSMRLS